MTDNVAEICATGEKLLVKVRRKDAKMLGLRRISVFRGLSGRRMHHVGDQTP